MKWIRSATMPLLAVLLFADATVHAQSLLPSPQADLQVRQYELDGLLRPDFDNPPRLSLHPPITQPAPIEATLPADLPALVNWLQHQTGPETWGEGTGAWLRPGSTHLLLVRQTPALQRQVQRQLDQLRQMRSICISIQSHVLGYGPNVLAALPPQLQKKIEAADSKSPILLEPAEAGQLLQAVKTANGLIMALPRVTIFNGMRSYVFKGTQTPYVYGSSQEPITAKPAPLLDNVTNGTLIDIRAIATPNRESVLLALRLESSRLLQMGSPAAAPADSSVRHPVVQLRQWNGRATVPAGKAVLIIHLTTTTEEAIAPEKGADSSPVVFLVIPTILKETVQP